jgi:hypothetical protein
MTSRDFELTQDQFFNICMKGERHDGSDLFQPSRVKTIQRVLKQKGKKPKIYNGRGLISLILPENFNYEVKNNAHPTEPSVKITQGVFLEGAFDKTTLGSEHGSIIQLLNKEYGTVITANFIDNMQFIGGAWLAIYGFSIGLEDCMITSEESVLAIKNKLVECYTKAEGIEETTKNPGIKEVRVTAALSQAKDVGMKIAKEAMRKDNNFLVTTKSGAKGDYFNISQITGLLGQQNLEGKRVTPALSHGKRTLPHYPFGDVTKDREYESRGFIRNSFIHGLTPHEFFFHSLSGREGICDTAMGTAQSGYIQRKIVKVCEDIRVQYDNTVRDAIGKIYQFNYGDTGYEPTKTVRVGGEPVICDVGRLIDRLNMSHELGIDDEKLVPSAESEPQLCMETIRERSVSTDDKKRKLITKIHKKCPKSIADAEWSVEELTQRVQSLDLDEDEDEDAEELEDIVEEEEDEEVKEEVDGEEVDEKDEEDEKDIAEGDEEEIEDDGDSIGYEEEENDDFGEDGNFSE